MNRGIGKKGILRNEKGLTLVELLAVVVIIGILAAIAVPSISGLITKTKHQAHRANAQMIVDAARMKVVTEDFAGGMTPAGGSTSTLTIFVKDLVDGGYLEKAPEDPENKNNPYLIDDGAGNASESFVTAVKNLSTGSITYWITLVGERDGAIKETYLNAVKEEDIKIATIN